MYTQEAKSRGIGAAFVSGHLAIIFGILMDGSAENQRILIDALPGPSQQTRMSGLLKNARDFLASYTQVTGTLSQLSMSASEQDDYASTATRVFTKARRQEGLKLAQNAIRIMEQL